jgi:hypothetical protein
MPERSSDLSQADVARAAGGIYPDTKAEAGGPIKVADETIATIAKVSSRRPALNLLPRMEAVLGCGCQGDPSARNSQPVSARSLF